eukprot:COSAG01_NODE_4908_length_4635_cov_2.867725_5_plen_67_part_00
MHLRRGLGGAYMRGLSVPARLWPRRDMHGAWHLQRLQCGVGGAAVSLKRLLDESPWLQFTSKCQRF